MMENKRDLTVLPDGWIWTAIKEITESMQNGIYKPSHFYNEDGIACLRMYNIEDGAIVWKDIKRMLLTPEEVRQYELRSGDILINRVNSRELVGKAAVISSNLEASVYESKNIRLRLFRNSSESKFVGFWFRVYSQKYFDQNAQQTVGMASINQEQIGSMSIPLPPLNEQCRIVTKIEALTARSQRAKEALDAIPPLLERFRQSVLAAAFRGDLTADWREKNPDVEPASVLLERIRAERRRRWEEAELEKMKASGKVPKDDKWKGKYKESPQAKESECLDLPKGWICVSSDKIFGFVTSGSRGWAEFYRETGALFLRVGNLNRQTIGLNLENVQLVQPPSGSEGLRTRVLPGDILISITADIGRVAIAPANVEEAYINQHVALARPVLIELSQYVGWFLTSEYGQAQLNSLERGATKAGLGLDDIRSVVIPLPSLPEQLAIIVEIERQLSTIKHIETLLLHSKQQIESLNQSILAKAFRGELVPQDPNDEPASVLLERIRAERETAGSKTKRGRQGSKQNARTPEATQTELPGVE